MTTFQEAREQFCDVIADVELQFAKIAVCPAAIPLYEFKGRELSEQVLREGRKVKSRSPVAYLRFDGEHLSFEQVALPYKAKDLPKCRQCHTKCSECRKRQEAARKRWAEQEAANARPVEVIDLEDTAAMTAVTKLLPAMHKRLVDDSKVTPEEIDAAIQAVEDFLTLS